MSSIFGWLADWHGCGRYRVISPLNVLSERGWEVDYNNLMPMEMVRGEQEVDLLIAQRSMQDGPTKNIQLHKDRGVPIVYELDDDFWNIDSSNRKIWQEVRNNPQYLDNMRQNLRTADLVTVSTEPLADVVSQYCGRVEVIPNFIDESLLEPWERAGRPITIGWGGSGTHDGDWRSIEYEISRLVKWHPEVRFKFIGDSTHWYELGIPRERCDLVGWLPIDEYYDELDFDIGIVPLAPTRFNDSKSDIKFKEMAARGIPVVASDWGPYRRSIEHGVTGFLAKHPRDWTDTIASLIVDDSLRQGVGDNAKEWARTQTIRGNIDRREQLYGELV